MQKHSEWKVDKKVNTYNSPFGEWSGGDSVHTYIAPLPVKCDGSSVYITPPWYSVMIFN